MATAAAIVTVIAELTIAIVSSWTAICVEIRLDFVFSKDMKA